MTTGSRRSCEHRARRARAGKPPLYFQHQGHSQTLIGVERIQVQPGHAAEVSLLLLDPGQDTAQLAAALREKRGWQVRSRARAKPTLALIQSQTA